MFINGIWWKTLESRSSQLVRGVERYSTRRSRCIHVIVESVERPWLKKCVHDVMISVYQQKSPFHQRRSSFREFVGRVIIKPNPNVSIKGKRET